MKKTRIGLDHAARKILIASGLPLRLRRLKRGVFVSVVDLQETINRFVVEHNAEPKPFIWTADPNKIIQAVRRGHQVLDSVH